MSKTNDLEAFCRACPRVEEVSAVLQGLGFSLVFHMAAVASPASSHTPPLPAQFHYRDTHGTEVIYLPAEIRQWMANSSLPIPHVGGSPLGVILRPANT